MIQGKKKRGPRAAPGFREERREGGRNLEREQRNHRDESHNGADNRQAGPANGLSGPYNFGDANLDGTINAQDLNALGQNWQASTNLWSRGDFTADGFVDGQDFIEWNNNKFTPSAAWCSGDFNADGILDGLDFILWNDNKFKASDGVLAVPEPTPAVLMCGALVLFGVRRRAR